MPTTVLYRINGGEVIKISFIGQSFTERDTTYWEREDDPSFPDGTDIIDPNTENSERRELGFAKIKDGTTVRNATQGEIDNFYTAEEEDECLQDRDGAIDLFNIHPRHRKLLIAMADITMKEVNLLRTFTRGLKVLIQTASNFGDVQSGVEALATLNDRDLTQFKNQIRARISEDD